MTKPDLETLAGNLARASVYTGDDIGLPLKEHGAPSGSGSYGSQFVMVSVKMRDEIIAALRRDLIVAALRKSPASAAHKMLAARLRQTIHMESAGIAPQTSALIEAARAAAEYLERKSPEAAPRALPSEDEIAALIREHAEVSIDGDDIRVSGGHAAASVILHRVKQALTSGQRTDPNSMDELERQGYFDDAGGHD
jgi:hypothetical protein